ncbi:hypothetical protein NUW58_g8579 [Xylaria curta]|uniref:Uncharacterized protein n=1 Tax=Xylaria curta TaxID=42375 RepID=A0ACC1N8A7_9PEZI|nr:hypothetical protein NUW58_g8579 [Xylaria curta]
MQPKYRTVAALIDVAPPRFCLASTPMPSSCGLVGHFVPLCCVYLTDLARPSRRIFRLSPLSDNIREQAGNASGSQTTSASIHNDTIVSLRIKRERCGGGGAASSAAAETSTSSMSSAPASDSTTRRPSNVIMYPPKTKKKKTHSTDPYLRDFTLVAGAARRAQLSLMVRDMENVTISS